MTASLGIRVIRSSLADWRSMKKECRHARHTFIFWIAGYSLFRTEGVSCSLEACRDKLIAIFDQKKILKKFQLYVYLQFFVNKTLDSDWIRILIRIRIHLKCWIRIRIQWSRIQSTDPQRTDLEPRLAASWGREGHDIKAYLNKLLRIQPFIGKLVLSCCFQGKFSKDDFFI